MDSNELRKKQKEYLWDCVATYYESPLVVERGEGMHLWDADGKKYLDFFAGILTTSIGYNNPRVVETVASQLKKVAHTSTLYVNEPQIRLAEKMAQVTPGPVKKSFFTNSGTEADETAMVLARLYTGRQEIIALRHSYSGRSMLAMSAAGQAPWKHGGTQVPGIVHAVSPYCYRCPLKLTYPSCELACAKDIEELIQTTTSGRVAAFIAEPIQGAGGFITPPKEYFQEAVAIVRKYGGVFICDEVQTGFGRTGGTWCGIEHWGVEPDIMTFAKGIANGAPLGATVAKPEIADKYPKLTISTFGGNPISCAAAVTTIEYIEGQHLLENARVVGDYMRENLDALKEAHASIGDVRGKGLMQAVELVKDRKTKEPAPEIVNKLMEETKKHGVLIGKGGLFGNVIRIGPPLIAQKDHVDELIATLDAGLTEAENGA